MIEKQSRKVWHDVEALLNKTSDQSIIRRKKYDTRKFNGNLQNGNVVEQMSTENCNLLIGLFQDYITVSSSDQIYRVSLLPFPLFREYNCGET